MPPTTLDIFDFRARLAAREHIFGTFLKFPTTQVVEILSVVGYDFVVIDEEHAPLDRGMTDVMILAARASQVVPLVRIGDFNEANVLSVLDCGASGVMVPHIDSVAKAKRVAESCRYMGGKRGFVGLSRASGWGRLNKSDHIRTQDQKVACIAMIEDLHAVELAADIAAVDGIDAIFIGQGDLGAALGDRPDAAEQVARMVEHIAVAIRPSGVPLMMIPSGPKGVGKARNLGAAALILSSDHGFLKQSACEALRAHREG